MLILDLVHHGHITPPHPWWLYQTNHYKEAVNLLCFLVVSWTTANVWKRNKLIIHVLCSYCWLTYKQHTCPSPFWRPFKSQFCCTEKKREAVNSQWPFMSRGVPIVLLLFFIELPHPKKPLWDLIRFTHNMIQRMQTGSLHSLNKQTWIFRHSSVTERGENTVINEEWQQRQTSNYTQMVCCESTFVQAA